MAWVAPKERWRRTVTEEVIKDGNLSIGAIIADGDSAIESGIKEVGGNDMERQHCTRHLTKAVGRDIMKDDLKSVKARTKALTKKKMLDLSRFVGKGCAWEFNAAHEKCGNDVEKLVILCRNLKEGVVSCLEGDWKTCRRVYLVCQAHKRGEKGKKCWVSLKKWVITFGDFNCFLYYMYFKFQDQKLLLQRKY